MIDHLVVKSSFKRRMEVFSFYIIGEVFRTNELLWVRVSFCVFIFGTWYVMPCGTLSKDDDDGSEKVAKK